MPGRNSGRTWIATPDRLTTGARKRRPNRRLLRAATWCALLTASLAPQTAFAQFGQNKVQYRSFDWRILETEHFMIHFYSQERGAAQEAARMAERGYSYLSDFFDHKFEGKIPIILYSNHGEFEQSNVIGGFIGEGTGGVTESLKGRVTLPLTGSYAELNHVLTHELVHAFQFDMMKRDFLGQIGIGPIPLWMVEGMAEWVSNGIDPVTAMWVMDAKLVDKIPTVQELQFVQDIRVYRMGQAMYEVIGKNFGPERVRRILKHGRNRPAGADSTFRPPQPPLAGNGTTFGGPGAAPSPNEFAAGTAERQSLEALWRAYADSLGRVLSTGLVQPDSVPGVQVIAKGNGYGRSFHLAPALSPDGKRVLFYSSRGFHNELFLGEFRDGKWKSRALVTGERTPELESLPLLAASADWAPDGQHVVFVATQQGRDVLQVLDTENGKIIRTIDTDLLSISNPSFSPDGRWIVFSALTGGEEDLFVIEVKTGKLVRLTDDAYAERTARFSPDGTTLVFATDRGPSTDITSLVFGPWNIARMELERQGDDITGGHVTLVIDSPANDFSPAWSPDGRSIAFVSDGTGTHQIHTYEFETGTQRLRTRFASGVIGIVPTGPALSWTRGNDMAYSVFRNGGWHIYGSHGFPEDLETTLDRDRMMLTRSLPPEVQEEAENQVAAEERNYRARLTPEYAVIGALYVGNAGAAGSGQLLLGDMLGNQYLLVAGNLRTEFDESEILLQYANLGSRWQWGLVGYQFRDDYLVFTASDRAELESAVRRGVGAQLYYPFNRFRRVEFSLDLQTVNRETARFLLQDNSILDDGRSKDQLFFAVPGVGLVHDNSSYSGFTPIAGGRWRTEYSRAIGDVDYNFHIADWRRYFNVHRRGAVATRFVSATTWGKDRERLRVGGPDTFRGADFGDIEGSTVTFANVELRFPVFPNTELLRGIAFFDIASSWGHGTLRKGEVLGSVELGKLTRDDVQTALGFGVRGFVGLPLRFDTALPQGNAENWQTFFSIGFDY